MFRFNVTFWPLMIVNILFLVWINFVPYRRARVIGDYAYEVGRKAHAAAVAGNWDKADLLYAMSASLYSQCFAEHDKTRRLLRRNRYIGYALMAYAFGYLFVLIVQLVMS